MTKQQENTTPEPEPVSAERSALGAEIAAARASETPVERAQRLGQGDEINPAVPTGQTPEDVAERIPASDSNEELAIAADKRRAAEDLGQPSRPDERGQVTR